MKIPRRFNNRYICYIILVTAGILCIYVTINFHRRTYLDINTCRIKESIFIDPILLWEKIEDTRCTQIILARSKNELIPEWKLDCSFTLYSPYVSPHFRYHGRIGDIRLFQRFCDDYKISEENQFLLTIALIHWLHALESPLMSRYERHPYIVIENYIFEATNSDLPKKIGSDWLNRFIEEEYSHLCNTQHFYAIKSIDELKRRLVIPEHELPERPTEPD